MYVYILRSQRNHLEHYVGLTTDVATRVRQHNEGHSAHTSKMRPWELVASIELADDNVARELERYLKTGSGRAFCRRHFGPR
jgi:putative endonuclease